MTDLRSEQRGVVLGVVIAIVAAAVVLGAGWTILPFTPPRVVMPGERLAYAIRVDLFVLVWLLIAIARVGNIRFLSADDIRGSGFAPPSPRLAMASAFLQNTLEQVALAVPAHLALAVSMRGVELVVIPLLAALFSVGRITFWIGYPRGAAARAFGFALTFMPTVLAWVTAVALWLLRG
jgi:hypothetical protein